MNVNNGEIVHLPVSEGTLRTKTTTERGGGGGEVIHVLENGDTMRIVNFYLIYCILLH